MQNMGHNGKLQFLDRDSFVGLFENSFKYDMIFNSNKKKIYLLADITNFETLRKVKACNSESHCGK